MIDERFIILGTILTLYGGLIYFLDTLKGKTKPNRVSWFIWSLAPLVAFYAEIRQGVGLQSLFTFIVGFVPLMVFIASFLNKKSIWKIGSLDVVCGVLSVFGIILWQITKEVNIAIALSIVADAIACIPTIIKSYHFPETENYQAYFMSFIAGCITLLTIKVWSFEQYGFPLYILAVSLILTILIRFKIGVKLYK